MMPKNVLGIIYSNSYDASLGALTARRTKVGGQAVLGRQSKPTTPWLTERHGYDPTFKEGETV